ncbi:contactin-5-like isoform X2 [Adelges cooleyi]|uniref:contactin-5-like isoform X2 n=1 Tax=Adelges cooleyi TaxID=133065 RepID=UPI0021808968|nr:contactin-5-like isoform X2 [Adelges cooleyi]
MRSGKKPQSAFGLFVCLTVLFALVAVDRVHCRPNQLKDNKQDQPIVDDDDDYMADGEGTDDEDDDGGQDGNVGGGTGQLPVILTIGLNVDAAEGTTVRLPCKVDRPLTDTAMIWLNGTKTIFTEEYRITSDPRVHTERNPTKEDYTLVIDSVTSQDAGTYTCKITSSTPVTITHELRITHPARIVDIEPHGKKTVVKKGEPVILKCLVAGFPVPTVKWTKVSRFGGGTNGAAGTGETESAIVAMGPEVRIESVASTHAGYYECQVENKLTNNTNADNTERRGIELEVEYPPEIVVPKATVNTGETYSAILTCTVRSHPKPKVSWEKDQVPIQAQPTVQGSADGSRYEINRQLGGGYGNGNSYQLKIKHIRPTDDFGKYRCRAENKYGVVYGEDIVLTGTPAKPTLEITKVMDSNDVDKKSGRNTELVWVLDSWSPVLEYQVQYKRQQDQDWINVKHSPKVTEPEDPTADERRYKLKYIFSDPEEHNDVMFTAATFVVRARARNVQGWSEWSTDAVFSEASASSKAAFTDCSWINIGLSLAMAVLAARHLAGNNGC